MSWAITFASSIAGMLAGAIGMFAIAHVWVKWYSVSSFEGGSGYFVVGLSLLGAIGGFILSIIAARLANAHLGPEWFNQLGAALSAVLVALTLTLAASYDGVDRVPEFEGKLINCVWEIRLPVQPADESDPGDDPQSWSDETLRLELVSVVNRKPRGWESARFDRDAFRQENGQWILVAKVPLFTSKGEFCVNLKIPGHDDGFWPAMRPAPLPSYFDWSKWTRTNKSSEAPNDAAAVMYRFKYETTDK